MNFYWLHPNTEVQNSCIDGKGRFATAKIAAQTLVMVVGGRIIERKKDRWVTGIPINEELIIQGSENFLDNGVVNHSCDPNLVIKGDISFYASREINPGDELTVDYGTFLFGPSEKKYIDPCNCSSRNCRRHITGGDWVKLKEQGANLSYFLQFMKGTEHDSLL